MRLGIGIDTGGTYTDAVLYDFDTNAVLGSAKALTTKTDLTIGILGALDGLPGELLPQAERVSLSTTLATNACVEDKGGKARLIFLGGDRDIIDRLGGKYGLPPAREILIQEAFTTFSGDITGAPDWDAFRAGTAEGFDDCAGVGIVESNAIKNGGTVEKAARAVFREDHSIPVVCGYELFNALNSLQRASSTLLNARLFPVIQEFLDAIKASLAQRGIHAPLTIVRSNGSLMSEAFAADRPVETLLCGPAASVIGAAGITLGASPDGVIVDMGGTTTDIAVMRGGAPVTAMGGVRIGKWRTFVDGLYVKTIGLGGDSAVRTGGGTLRLESFRVVPLCAAAAEYPQILDTLRQLDAAEAVHTKPLHEHYILTRDISDNPHYSDRERAFCRALRGGPLSVREAPLSVGLDMYSLGGSIDRLLREGAVQLCGLTPTDIMHLRGDFRRFNAEAAELAVRFAARNMSCTPDELCGMVYAEVKRKLYSGITEALLENKDAETMRDGVPEALSQRIDESWREAGAPDSLLSVQFRTAYPLIGIGAPIGVFLGDVADALGTKAVIAPHYEVANALGAIMGSVTAAVTVRIRPALDEDALECYHVFAGDGRQVFYALEEAEAFAEAEARAAVTAEAKRRGAAGMLTVTCEKRINNAPARDAEIYMGTDVAAQATGAAG